MEAYQPIYDAVRSRISNGDIGEAIAAAMRNENIGHYAGMAFESVRQAAWHYERPSVMFRPALSIDGNQWCALYGENLQEGVAGFGSSPDASMSDFDNNWRASLVKHVARR